MIDIAISNEGNQVIARIKGLPEKMHKEVFDILYTYGQEMRNYIRESMKNTQTSSEGLKRTKGSRNLKSVKFHYPSLPGFPPAIDSGALYGSIVVEAREGQGEVEVGSHGNAPYAPYLEKGTYKMQPRPYLMPAFNHIEGKIENGIMEAIRRSTE